MTVYYARLEDTGRIKIGHSEDPKRRAHDLAIQFRTDVTLLAVEAGGYEREMEVLEEFAASRAVGCNEIFRPSPALVRRIESLKIEPFRVRYRTRAEVLAERRTSRRLGC